MLIMRILANYWPIVIPLIIIAFLGYPRKPNHDTPPD